MQPEGPSHGADALPEFSIGGLEIPLNVVAPEDVNHKL
jgi:hypothetical protein